MVKVGDYLRMDISLLPILTLGDLYEVKEVTINSITPYCQIETNFGRRFTVGLDSFGNLVDNTLLTHIPAKKIKLLKDKILEVW